MKTRKHHKSHNKYFYNLDFSLARTQEAFSPLYTLPYLIYLFMIILAVFIALVASSPQKYTNAEAFQCFAQRAFSVCSSEFQQCSQSPQCQSQLQTFSDCSFNDAQKDQQKIFNGYCFRRWNQRAFQTRKVINCLNETCNLLYNSQIGMAELYKCLQSTLLDKEVECGDECESQIEKKIGMQMYEQPIMSLYGQKFQNEEAINLVNIVNEECLNEHGKGKEMIYKEETLKEQQRPKRNQQEEPAAQL